jgi:hypothetical protein
MRGKRKAGLELVTEMSKQWWLGHLVRGNVAFGGHMDEEVKQPGSSPPSVTYSSAKVSLLSFGFPIYKVGIRFLPDSKLLL